MAWWVIHSVSPSAFSQQPGYQYCVRTPNYVDETGPSGTITSATLTTSTIGPIAPTQTGQPSNCNKWHIAQCQFPHLPTALLSLI